MSRNSGARMNCTDPSPAGAIWRYLIISDALNAATVGAWASAPWNELNGFGGFPLEVCLINQGRDQEQSSERSSPESNLGLPRRHPGHILLLATVVADRSTTH
jgi:hypothetical protein